MSFVEAKDNVRNLGLVLLDAKKLNRLWRWPGQHIMGDTRPSVATHSFSVMQIAQFLGIVEEQEFSTEIDWKVLYQKALNHDFLEAYTGDIKGPVKNYDIEVKKRIEELEEIFADRNLYCKLSPKYGQLYRQLFSSGKDDTVEGKILKAADIIDLILECLSEILVGNPSREFLDAYVEGIKKLKNMDLGSVKLFLEVTIHELLDSTVGPTPVNVKEITQKLLKD